MHNLSNLIRLHIEAVWHVQLHSDQADDSVATPYTRLELAATTTLPNWKLCLAQPVAPDLARVALWRPDISPIERSSLLTTANAALDLSPADYRKRQEQFPGIHREIAFQQTAQPAITLAAASSIAHPLTHQHAPLLAEFEAISPSHYLDPSHQPLVGVIAENKLLCLAHSSRRTNEACELGIDTLPSARRKGYALAATILWAETVKQTSLIPIYSAFIENEPSLALAHNAGYRPFAHVVTLQ